MRLRRKNRQAGPDAGAVVAAPMGKRARAGLVQHIRGALVRRQAIKAVASIPAGAALAVGLAVGIAIGAALMLSTIVQLVKEQQ